MSKHTKVVVIRYSQLTVRRFHSTETSLLNTFDQVYTAADASKPTFLVYLDLSAAFYTIDHPTLLSRLWCFGHCIWLDRAHSIGKLQQQPLIRLNSQELSSSPSVRDLGVIIDSGLTLTTHVSILARTCFYQLQRIRQAKKNLDEDSVKTLVHALVLSRLDYCNSVLANLPEVTLAPLIRVQHSAARLIRNLRRQDSVSLVMMELHWLPLHHRITFKLCTLMHGIHHGHCPKYMKEMVLPVSTLPGRERLRSAATQNYDIRRVKLKFGERAFAVAAPKAWNSLPDSLKQTNDTVKFRKDLKTYLFNLAYN